MPDHDAVPEGGGVFRRLGAGRTTGGASIFAGFEEIFAPTRHDGRQAMEELKHATRQAPAPTDPPELSDADPADARRRFTGRVVVRRP